jgi:hypothetical protein
MTLQEDAMKRCVCDADKSMVQEIDVEVIKNVFLSSLKAKEELSDMVLIVYGEELETMARKVRMS